MASYASYKKIVGSQVADATIPATALQAGTLATWDVKWIYGSPEALTAGCCCLWTVPSGVSKITFELWGAGGNGHGSCNCSRCQNYIGAQGGYYNSKTLATAPGCTYTVCAGGVYGCCSQECLGCQGCTTYVTGYNLSGFCALGGAPGCAIGSWDMTCFSQFPCCVGPSSWGGDFAMGNHEGGSWRPQGVFCHCHGKWSHPTSAPFIGTQVKQELHSCWIRCGCWTVPYGHGGQGAMTNVCGSSCCGQGGTGGSGLVKISYI
jgi:hypothetical protein